MLYRVKLPIQNPTQTLAFQAGASRFVFNWGLELCIKAQKRTAKLPKFNDICSKLHKLKKKEPWLKSADAHAIQQSLRDLYSAINLMFKAGFGFPKFKARRHTQPHFRTGMGIKLEDNTIKIGKLGTFKIRRRDKKLDGRLMSVSCKQEGNGRWYASLLLEGEDRTNFSKTKRSIGIDMGSRIFARGKSTSGKVLTWRRPEAEKAQLEKTKRLHKELSKKVKGSNRREKAKEKLKKAYFKLQNMRKDFDHKLSHKVVSNYDRIAVENLNVKGLMRTKSVAKGFQQAAIGEFLGMLKYKAGWYGRVFTEVDPRYTSKTCPSCGCINDLKVQTFKKTSKGRWWRCQDCGEVHERDTAGATNVLRRGQQIWAPKEPSPRRHKTSSPGRWLSSLKREAPGLSPA